MALTDAHDEKLMGIEVSYTHRQQIRRPRSTAKHSKNVAFVKFGSKPLPNIDCHSREKLENVGRKDVLEIGVDSHHSQTLDRFISPTR